MGTGNFENDWCADRLAEYCDPLLAEIQQSIKAIEADPNDIPDETVPAYLEIIACLSENLGRYEHSELADILYPCVVPHPNTLVEWKQKYLSHWDQCIANLDPCDEYAVKRRNVIVHTFDRVIRLALARCDKGTFPDIRATIRYLSSGDPSDS